MVTSVSLLERVLNFLGRDLSHEARRGLLEDVHPVSAVSILHKLGNRSEDVRNPEGFVMVAIKKCRRDRTVHGEFECAIKELRHSGFLTEEDVVESEHKLADMLVSNASSSKPPPSAAGTLLERLVDTCGFDLDEKVRHGLLYDVHPISAVSMLHKLASKGEEVRSPVAFVGNAIKQSQGSESFSSGEFACALKELLHLRIVDDEFADRATSEDLTPLLLRQEGEPRAEDRNDDHDVKREPSSNDGERLRLEPRSDVGGLRVEAADAHTGKRRPSRPPTLDDLPPHAAQALEAAIDAILKLRGKGTLENQAAAEDAVKDAVMAAFTAGGAPHDGQQPYESSWHQTTAPPTRARVPSPPPPPPAPPPPASSADTGGPPRSGNVKAKGLRDVYSFILDERTLAALDGAGEFGDEILRRLHEKAGQVRNPSAYVMTGIRRWKEGKDIGGGRKDQSDGKDDDREDDNDDRRDRSRSVDSRSEDGRRSEVRESDLTNDARDALDSIDGDSADDILRELRRKGNQVKHPSGWVIRAVQNVKANRDKKKRRRSSSEDSSRSRSRSRGRDRSRGSRRRDDQEVDSAIDPWRDQLEPRALEMLYEIQTDDLHNILRQLRVKGSTINNLSAYVIKSCANARKGLNGLSAAKKRRT